MTERHDCADYPSTRAEDVETMLSDHRFVAGNDPLHALAKHLHLHLEALRQTSRTRDAENVAASRFYVRLEEAFALLFPCPVPSCRARRGKPCPNGPPLHRRRVARALASVPENV